MHHQIFPPQAQLRQMLFLSLIIFSLLFITLSSRPELAFQDADMLWHIAAGDLYRSKHFLVTADPWSFSSGEHFWYNNAWLWDVPFSYIKEKFGWHGVSVANAIIISTALAIVFFTCLLKSSHGIASFITLLALLSIIPAHARPLQISVLFVAFTYLLLELVASYQRKRLWLVCIPLLVAILSNIHGGFLAIFVLLGAYGMQSLIRRDFLCFKYLFMTGLASLAASLCNPFYYKIYDSAFRVLSGSITKLVAEWQPMHLTFETMLAHIYIPLFFALLIFRPLRASTAERLLTLFWLFMCFSSARYLSMFGIVSAPIVACMLKEIFEPKTLPPTTPYLSKFIERYNIYTTSPKIIGVGISVTAFIIAIQFTQTGADFWKTNPYTPVKNLSEELGYIQTHYPHVKFLNEYNLGGPIILATQGSFPVFIDGRADTAYPSSVLEDYMAFVEDKPDWQKRMQSYPIGGMILGKHSKLANRMHHAPGWILDFSGENAYIFIREKN